MPLLPTPDIQDLEDILFGSGAFMYGWFHINEATLHDEDSGYHFPATIDYYEDSDVIETRLIKTDHFIDGIKKYAELLPDRSYSDLIEDMDAADVDAIIQLIFWGEIRLS